MHAIVAQILPDWRATATGQTCSDVIQLLALLNAWLDDEPGPRCHRTNVVDAEEPLSAIHS